MTGIPNTNAPIAGPGGIITRAWQNFFAAGAQADVSTVNGLPQASKAGAGNIRFVTDSTTTAITGLGLIVAGGGAHSVLVYSDGEDWIVI